jgi:hypothetical protein
MLHPTSLDIMTDRCLMGVIQNGVSWKNSTHSKTERANDSEFPFVKDDWMSDVISVDEDDFKEGEDAGSYSAWSDEDESMECLSSPPSTADGGDSPRHSTPEMPNLYGNGKLAQSLKSAQIIDWDRKLK